ncbi:MAG: hypothetical protein D6B25_08310 [Desulfobulbaceae bacterium]|nr:MAG: hypothetical protein D6B25_08310 [Desulfobulbaceae bacterium]
MSNRIPEEITPQSTSRDIIYTLRTAHQGQMHQLTLADQKANILIGIIAVSLTIIFSNIDKLGTLDNRFLICFQFFIILEAIALLLALRAIMPRVRVKRKETLKESSNPFYYKSYTRVTRDVFSTFVISQLTDDRASWRMLLNDYYQIGEILRKKHSALEKSYFFAALGVMILALASAIYFMVHRYL